MPRKKSQAVSEGNDPVPRDTSGIGGVTMDEIYQIMSEGLDKSLAELEKNLNRMSEITYRMLRATNQRLADLELDAR